MARLVHGFKIVKHRYYIPIIIVGLLAFLAYIYITTSGSQKLAIDVAGALGISFFRLVLAYFVSLIVALVIAIPLSQSRTGDFLIPIFDLLQNLPSFALIPLFVYFLGYSTSMVIIFAASSILWPILFYVLHALKTARTDYNDAATVFGAKGWKRDIHYLLPLSFSAAVTGSIVGMAIGWESVIGVEIIGLTNGVGVFLNSALETSKSAFTFGLCALLLLVFALNRLVWMPLLKKTQTYED
jgi:ABC-type nitrate/sulfonate/bicarbonate transport system permease component